MEVSRVSQATAVTEVRNLKIRVYHATRPEPPKKTSSFQDRMLVFDVIREIWVGDEWQMAGSGGRLGTPGDTTTLRVCSPSSKVHVSTPIGFSEVLEE